MNYELEFCITLQDIYNKLSPENREKFKYLKFTNTTVLNGNEVKISCMISEEPIKRDERKYLLSSIPDGSFNFNHTSGSSQCLVLNSEYPQLSQI